MLAQKIKIAHVWPKLQGKLDDNGLKIVNGTDNTGDSSTSTTGGHCYKLQGSYPDFLISLLSWVLCAVIHLHVFHRFSSCYDHDSTQVEIYHQDIEPLLDIVYTGIVCFLL